MSKRKYVGIFKNDNLLIDQARELLIGYFASLMQSSFNHVSLIQAEKSLTSLAFTDDVTGLYNQRKLNVDLDFNIKRAESGGSCFSLIFIDIDHFKSVNDGHGHLTGSLLLVELAQVLKKDLRETDYIYRYGGDEFVVIIPDANGVVARQIGERILNAIKNKQFLANEAKNMSLSVSIGVAEYPKDASTKVDILNLADDMMYKAKNSGRGRVCSAVDLLAEVEERKKA